MRLRGLTCGALVAFTVPLAGQSLSITNTSLPYGSIGVGYSAQLTAAGGSGSYQWSDSGNLPPGLTLDAFKGAILGTPTAGGTYNDIFTVTDLKNNVKSSKTLSIGILQISTPSPLPGATIGSPYTATFTVSDGPPQSAYVWSARTVPPGLSFSSPGNTNATLSGTPSATGTYSISVSVSNDATGTSANKTFALTVASSLSITTGSPLPAGDANSPYKATLAAAGGSPPYRWTVISGSLPGGLTLDPNQGVISGTPAAAGSAQFTVQVTDSAGANTSKLFSVNINPALVVTNSSPLPNGTVGVPYTLTFNTTGGQSPYSYTAQQVNPFSPGALPSGMILSQSGFLNGTPDTAGKYSFNLLVTDATGSQVTKGFTITIAPPLVITTTSPLPSGGTGTPYQQTLAASGGTPPYSFTATGLPPGLSLSAAGALSGTPSATGNFTIHATVTDSLKVAAIKDLQITIAATAPQIQVQPASLAFSALAGGDSPPPQALLVQSGGATPATFRIVLDGGSSGAPAPAWISVQPTSGTTPARILVNVDQGNMGPGNYTAARIRVIDSAQNALDVPVSLAVSTAAPVLESVPTLLRYAARVGTPAVLEQSLVLRNSGGGGPINFTATVLGNASWITGVTPGSGQTARNTPVYVRVRVSTQGLRVGSYRDVIRLASSAGNIDIPVTLFVAPNGSIIGLDVTGVRFQARQGGGYATPTAVHVLNLGDSTVHWAAEIVSGGNVVTLSPATGSATPSAPGEVRLALASGATQLSPGGYHALVRFTDPQSLNSPQYVDALLDLASSDTLPKPDPFPIGLLFTGVAGGASPAPQQVSVYTSSSTAVPFFASASTPDGRSWLSVSPANGVSTGQTPGTVTVAVNTTGLPAGIYSGEIDFAMSGFVRTENVNLILAGASTAAAAGPAANCTASQLAMTESGLINNFVVPAGWPATLIVQLNDNCGAAVPNGSVVASFSNGDPPLSLRGDAQGGTYSATWQPGGASSQMTVTLQATAGTLQPATTRLIGGIGQNQTPVLARNGTLHNENPVIGGPLAPGTVAQVFGSALAPQTISPGVLPLATTFDNTFVIVGGLQAPLYFLSDGQLNIQIPNELPANQQHAIVISANGQLTIPDQIDVVPVVPGVAAFQDGHIIAQHGADFTLVDATHPAKPGEFLIMYLAGMGPTNPAVKSGDPAPSTEPLARVTNDPTVTVDGQKATIVYAGLTPGAAGLYQINFQVPANARSGELDVVVDQNGQRANVSKLIVKP